MDDESGEFMETAELVCIGRSELIQLMQFGVFSQMGPRNHELDVSAHGRHLANTIE